MRHESLFVEGPEEIVIELGVFGAAAPDDDGQILQICLGGQAAGGAATPLRRLALQHVEIHPVGHSRGGRRARCTKSSTSSGTGRPVLPFCAPPSQAVPATSRCAQSRSLVNLERNVAAVLAPPSRLPTLAKSAKLLFRPSA